MLTVKQIVDGLQNLTTAELRQVHQATIEHFKAKQDFSNQVAKASFFLDQQVEFMAKHGIKIVGTLIKKGPKNVKVRQTNICATGRVGAIWTVAPALIKSHDHVVETATIKL